MTRSYQQKEKNKGCRTETNGVKVILSFRTILTLFLSIVTVGIVVMLIWAMPPEKASAYLPPDSYRNFFYRRGCIDINTEPLLGFYIFFPIVMVLLPLSGFLLFPKKFNLSTRLLIYSNWVLYLIPIIMFFIKVSIIGEEWILPVAGFLTFLSLYPFCLNFFIQLAMLVDKKSFFDWSGLSRENYSSKIPKIYLRKRRINIGCFLLIYGLVYAFQIWVLVDSDDIGFYSSIIIISGGILMLLWLLLGDFFLRRYSTTKQLLQDLKSNSELFDNPSFIKYVVQHQWKVFKKQLVRKQITLGINDLRIISRHSTLHLELVREIIKKAISKGTIKGSLSKDQNIFISSSES
jgi:hypothetical protein